MMKGKSVEEIHVGDAAEFSKKITDEDVRLFKEVSADKVHAAGTTRSAAAPEMLCAALISTVLGSLLPGPGMRYLSQTLYFRQSVLAGDTLTIRVTVADKLARTNWIELKTVCLNQKGDVVTEGTAAVMPSRNETSELSSPQGDR